MSPFYINTPLFICTQVWFGYRRAAETWKVDPFLYQILLKTRAIFIPESQILSKIY